MPAAVPALWRRCYAAERPAALAEAMGEFMRIGAGFALMAAMLSAGCSALPGSLFPGGHSMQPETHAAMPAAAALDDPTGDPGEKPHRKVARARPADDGSKAEAQSRTGSIELMSPGWAKEQQPEREESDKSLDKAINSVCRGC